MTIDVFRIMQLASRAVIRANPRIVNPREVAQAVLSAALDEILADAFGGDCYEIRNLRNPDHLKIDYDFAPLFNLAGGGWQEILSAMLLQRSAETPRRGRSPEDEPRPVLSGPPTNRDTESQVGPGPLAGHAPDQNLTENDPRGPETTSAPAGSPGQPPAQGQE